MKKFVLLLTALVAMGLSHVMAYDFSAVAPSGQTLYYDIIGGSAMVTYQNSSWPAYSNLTGALVIPATVTYNSTTYSVTSIGYAAFRYCDGLTSVTIPNSVTSIGPWAFQNCSDLTSVTIPNSVTSIEGYAFYGCSGLTSVTIPSSVTYIDESAFSGCSGLTSVTIPSSVTSIGSSAFSGCSGLTSIIVESGNTHYDSRNNCNAIIETNTNKLIAGCKNTIIPNSVTSIGDDAFSGCSGLTGVTIPNSVTSIGGYAFYYCSGLTSVTIPNSVTSIGNYAFNCCNGLTSVTIPNSVTSIGNYVFYNCSSLTSVTIPNSVTSIGTYAFHGCGSLTSVTIPNSVTFIGNYAFYNCSGLTSVTIGNSVTSIGNYAFHGCSSLTSVTIPNSVTSIGSYAFYDCSGLTSVTIPNSVTTIGGFAFFGCSNVDTLYYNARNLTTTSVWGNYNSCGFRPMTLKHLVIGDSVQTLPDYVFYNQDSLTSVTIPNSVTSIGSWAFYGCSGLTSVTIPNSVTFIGSYAFYGCSGLTSVTIPNSVTSIGEAAFQSCSGLTSVTMRGTVPPTLGGSVFYGNASNRKIYVPCGAYDNYYNANNGWSNYRNYLSDPIVDIDVTLNTDTERGSVFFIPLHNQNVRCDSTVVVTATPNYGYHFDHWSTGSTQVQDTIVIDRDTMITAYFAKNQYTIVLLSDDESLGMVGGGGIFDYLDTVILTATTTAEHHHFVRWSDGNRENPRQYVVTEDETLTAYFAVDTHSVAVVSNDPTRGMVTSSGSEFEYLSPCTVTATAYTGFVFTGWSNGVTANPYTFAVQNDVELTAIFVSEDELMFTITVETDDPTMGSVSGGGMAMSGGEVTIHAVANEGYHFVRWNDNNTNADRTVIVTEDATYTAYFAANQTQGVENVETMAVVKVISDCITIEGAEGEHVMIFDVTGRVLVNEPMAEGKRFRMPRNGVYMVKVGNHPAQKVVVIK